MDLNETSGAALEANDIPLQLLEHETSSIKSEVLSTDIKLESLEPVESDENILVKQELDIKSEDETVLDDTHYQDKQPCKLEKFFMCIICGYSTNYKSNFKDHLRTHTVGKPFKCNLCGYRSIDKGALQKHLRIHSGEKLFKCNLCNYSCRVSSALKNHLRTHTGEKPFECNVCNKTFSQKINLKTHMMTHNREKSC